MTPEQARQYTFLPFGGLSLQIARAEGSYLVTADGRRILDAAAGAIAANIGHGHPDSCAYVAAPATNALVPSVMVPR